jgi:hypothetical protein
MNSDLAEEQRRLTADHEFGSQATELKLSVVEAYLRAFTNALRGKFPQLYYAGTFARTGGAHRARARVQK